MFLKEMVKTLIGGYLIEEGERGKREKEIKW